MKNMNALVNKMNDMAPKTGERINVQKFSINEFWNIFGCTILGFSYGKRVSSFLGKLEDDSKP